MPTPEELVEEYLAQVRDSLHASQQPDSDLIVDELRAHVNEELAAKGGSSPSSVRQVLDELGSPDAIARAGTSPAVSADVVEVAHRRRTRRPMVVALGALFVGAVIAGVLVGTTTSPPVHHRYVDVPNVIQTPEEFATGVLTNDGFTFVIEQTVKNAAAFPGEVMAQSPAGGTRVVKGTLVTLVVGHP